jgi:hypothetical protein
VRELENLVRRLSESGVEFVVIGGLAAVAHGGSRMTMDLDVCAPFTGENLERLRLALHDLRPRFRDKPERGLPEDLSGFKNLYLHTGWGDLDVLGEVAGIGGYPEAVAQSIEVRLWGRAVHLLSLDALIDAKRALGREKDREALRELELIRARLKEP